MKVPNRYLISESPAWAGKRATSENLLVKQENSKATISALLQADTGMQTSHMCMLPSH